MARNTGDIKGPVAAIDHDCGACPAAESVAPLPQEEIVFVLRAPEANAGYLVYSLSEGSSNSDGAKPFSVSVVHAPQLPEDSPLLAEFLLDRNDSGVPPPHLRLPRRVHVVVSTRSGLRQARGFYENGLRPLLAALGLEALEERGDAGQREGYRVTVTRDSNTIREFARALGKYGGAGEATVILLSGDGGVVDLLNGLDQAAVPPSDEPSPPPPPTIALLPLGTGNALFHSLHKPHYAGPAPMPSPLVLGLRTLFRGTPAPLPTFRASFSPGARLIPSPSDPEPDPEAEADPESSALLVPDGDATAAADVPVTHLLGAIVASYGFHASLVWESDTPAYRVHGARRFGMAAAELLREAHAYDARVEVRRREGEGEASGAGFRPLAASRGSRGITNGGGDGESGKGRGDGGGRLSYVLATLVSNLERTFAISPASRPLDGQLRLVWFGDIGGDKTMDIMMAAYREGAHVGMAEVGYEAAEEIKVTIDEEDARWRKVCVDGSIVEVERGGWMSVSREKGRDRLRVLWTGGVGR